MTIIPKSEAVLDFQNQLEDLKTQITSVIPEAKLDPKTSDRMMKITLPFTQIAKFSELFEMLEGNPSIELLLELNSLENVFVNIELKEKNSQHEDTNKELNLEIPTIPQSLYQEHPFKTRHQVLAVFKRKIKISMRNWSYLVCWLVAPLGWHLLSIQQNQDFEKFSIIVCGSFLVGLLLSTRISTAFLIEENEAKLKYFLRTIGLDPTSYWLGNILADLFINLFYANLGLFIAFLSSSYMTESWRLFCPIITFAIASQNLDYLFTFIYKYDKRGIITHIILIVGFALIPLTIFSVKYYLTNADIIVNFILSPPMLFYYACYSSSKEYTAFESILPVILLSAQALVYFALILHFETQYSPAQNKHSYHADIIPNSEEVREEYQRVKNPQNDYLLRAINLKKEYSNGSQALRGITFGIKEGQVFGLLGPSGSGKSTALELVAGLSAKDSGQVILNNCEVKELNPKYYEKSGLCPQQNLLWDSLTVKEHLDMIGQIRGLGSKQRKEVIAYWGHVLRIQEHFNKKVHQLSKGTKRKLSLANILITAPNTIFLDEPSEGMDAISKRLLYETLRRDVGNRKPSILLNTQLMLEASILCDKIGILMNGKLVYIGDLADLRKKYGAEYMITIVKKNSNENIYEEILFKAFPGMIKKIDKSEIFRTYKVPSENFSFAKLFGIMEDLKTRAFVSDYNICNTTLEHMFLKVTESRR